MVRDKKVPMFKFSLICLPAISLAGWLSMFAIKHRSLRVGDMAGLVYHLALVPLVGILPGGPAVKFAGYLWLYMDAFIDVVSINHIGQSVAWSLRMGVHLFAAIWICGVSWELGGIIGWLGLPLGLGLAVHAILLADTPGNKRILGLFVIPMMSAWLLALQRLLLESATGVT